MTCQAPKNPTYEPPKPSKIGDPCRVRTCDDPEYSFSILCYHHLALYGDYALWCMQSSERQVGEEQWATRQARAEEESRER